VDFRIAAACPLGFKFLLTARLRISDDGHVHLIDTRILPLAFIFEVGSRIAGRRATLCAIGGGDDLDSGFAAATGECEEGSPKDDLDRSPTPSLTRSSK
jgi:hypothetical protein